MHSVFANVFIVLVILLVLFFLLCYFRIYKPFLNLGLPPKEQTATGLLKHKIAVINGAEYSYWTNDVNKPSKILVMLSPSSATGDFFENYAKDLPKDILLIAPDYPGRGETDDIKGVDTIQLVAKRISILLENLLSGKSFELVAPSFGGAVATELVKDSNLKIDKLFLIATGEFFTTDQKLLFHILFWPATLSESIRRFYEGIIIDKFGLFTDLKGENLSDILEQWLSTLDYKVNTNFKSEIPTIIVIFKNDSVVQSDSIIKLEKVYKNYIEFTLDVLHATSGFIDPSLIEIIKTNM